MAQLFADGCGRIGAAADITQVWDSGTTANLSLISTALGQACQQVSSGTYTKAWGSNDATVFSQIRYFNGTGTSGSQYFYLSLMDGAAAQVTLRLNDDGSVSVYSGGPTGTLLGSASAVFTQAAWNSFQMKVVVHNTTGSVEVRKNGSSTPILALTNVNTRGGSGNAYANGVQLGTSSNITRAWQHLFLHNASGAGPTDWLGDFRPITQFPASAVSTAFTANTGTNLAAVQSANGDTSYVSSSTVGAEDLYGFATLASLGVSPSAIIGVQPFAVARRTDAGARTMSLRAKSGATDASVVADAAMPTSYKCESAFLAVDPATSAAWTTGGVDALAVGVKIDA